MGGATPEETPAVTRLQLRASWIIAATQLKAAKAKEAMLRLKVVFEEFNSAAVGTTYSEDGAIKVVKKLTYTLDKDGDKIIGALAQIAELLPTEDWSHVIKWSASLDTGVYESMPKEAQALLNPLLTIKPAMPTLALAADKDAA